MSHADRFRSSNASISREDWDRVFGKEIEICIAEDRFPFKLSKEEEREFNGRKRQDDGPFPNGE